MEPRPLPREPNTRRLRSLHIRVASGAIVAVAALVAVPPADAHIRSSVVAVDYRATVSPLSSPVRAALTARIYQSDRALGLTVLPGHAVVVLGYEGEPFVRLNDAGLAVNAASLTAAGVGLVERPPRAGRAGTVWRFASSRRNVVWHDARIRGLPPGVDHKEWTVPLVVDGRRERLAGQLRRLDGPSAWPWVALGVPFVAFTAILLFSRRAPLIRRAAVTFGLLAAAAVVTTSAGFVFDAYVSTGKWVEAANVVAFASAGTAVVARGSRGVRGIAGGALGLLGLSVGFLKLPVFLHGVVLSVLPATFVRAVVALAIWAGGAATVLGVAVFADMLERDDDLRALEYGRQD